MDYQCAQAVCDVIDQVKASCKNGGDVYYDSNNNVLCIKGEIDVFGNMLNKIKSFNMKENLKVELESIGGGVDTAIGIVDYIKKFDYNAVVYKDCISSCAQFLFIGTNKRIISKGGRVIFHGGPFTDDEIKEMNPDERSRNQIRQTNDNFIKFYADRKIPLDALYKHPDRADLEINFGGTIMKIMSKNEFKKYGIDVYYCKR